MKTPLLNRVALAAIVTLALMQPVTSPAQESPGDPRQVAADAVNRHPSFLVRVEVDHLKRMYKGGDVLKATVKSEKAGYLYLFYCDADAKVTCLFPNKFQADNKIPGNEAVAVPHPQSNFRLRVGPPYGWEILTAVVTQKPLDVFKDTNLTSKDATPLTLEQFRGVFAETHKPDGPHKVSDWAEHHLKVLTYDEKKPSEEAQKLLRGLSRRVGVFIGVSEYQSKQIRKLACAHRDAAALAEMMKKHAGLDEVTVVTNRDATLERIEELLRKKLPAQTQPGDTVFVYWSGHGGRCADPASPGGFDEFLVPHDGSLANLAAARKTMILDETFGRWMQELDGRRIVLILDACYSAGVSAEVRDPKDEPAPFRNFLEGFLKRARNLGQQDAVLLASSGPRQVSFERRQRDHSVMTYYLIERLQKTEGSLSLRDAFAYVKEHVPAYVGATYPGQTQTPVLIPENDATPLRIERGGK